MKEKVFFLTMMLSLLLCGVQYSFSQVNDNLIFSFDQFHVNTLSFTPSLTDTSSKINCLLGDRSYKGVYNGINTRFFQGSYLIANKTNQNHSIGIQFNQSNMGDFIRTNTLYGIYGFRIALNNKFSLTSGINLGYKSLILDPSDVGGGGTSHSLSSSLGFGLLSKKLTILIGYKDFLNNNLTYNQFQISSPVSYNLYLKYLKKLTENWQLNLHVLGEYNNKNENNYRATVICKWDNKLDLGAGYRKDKGSFVLVGISNIDWQLITLACNVSYLVMPNFRFETIPNQVLEITLNIGY